MIDTGPCKFSQLPDRYQKQFESGQPASTGSIFLPYEPSSSGRLTALWFGTIYIVPGLFLIYSGLYYAVKDPALVRRVVDDATSGLIQLGVAVAIFAVVIWGLTFMLGTGWRSIARLLSWRRMQRASEQNQHYGMLLDDKNMVISHGEYFDDFTCAIIPRLSITDSADGEMRIWFPKRSYNIDVVRVRYTDQRGRPQELVIKERFSIPARQMCQTIEDWRTAKNLSS